MTDPETEQQALDYIKSHQQLLIDTFAKGAEVVSQPVSLFMAGSPGAGKTEVSQALMGQFTTVPIRIDADEIRTLCPGYIGANAHLFQKAATKGVHILYDYALHNTHHLILDGTFAYGNALQNIKRSIDKGRTTELWFIYQEPLKAWEFTQAREAIQCRHVSKGVFVSAFLKAQENAKTAKSTFGDKLVLNLLVKNVDNTDGALYLNIQAAELDHYIGTTYTQDTLDQLLV